MEKTLKKGVVKITEKNQKMVWGVPHVGKKKKILLPPHKNGGK